MRIGPTIGAILAWLLVGTGGAGCKMLDTSSTTANQPGALSWLTNWASQPMEMAPGFDLEEIKPAPVPPVVVPRNVLEVTIWDLYEPGKPYTFPARVADDFQIEVPMLGHVNVHAQTLPQIETTLVDAFRAGEFLLNPRVIVRSLEVPIVKVQLAGAVNRPGLVELTRNDRSVYAAILSAGGLSKTASTQIAVTRAIPHANPNRPATSSVGHLPPTSETTLQETDGEPASSIEVEPNYELRTPRQRANMAEEISVSPEPRAARSSPTNRGLYAVGDPYSVTPAESATNKQSSSADQPNQPVPAYPSNQSNPAMATGENLRMAEKHNLDTEDQSNDEVDSNTVWYNMALPRDRDLLKAVLLSEGDIVTIKAANMPLRISGVVNHSGEFSIPPGRSLNVWQAIELAGSVRDPETPLNITLIRPAIEGRVARRWTLSVPAYDQHPATAPLVEPGDELHVAPTTGSRIKRAVRGVWSKPQ